jgi:hypothetical protein
VVAFRLDAADTKLMAIISSVIESIGEQRDGRRWVHEKHTDHRGEAHERQWLAEPDEDLDAALAGYAEAISDTLREAEIGANMAQIKAEGSLAVVGLEYSTIAQNRAQLREEYRNATRTEAIMIGDYLNTFSDVQLQAAFGLTAGQAANLRANKLTPAASAATTIRAMTGA